MDKSKKIKVSKLLKKARERAKKDTCFICGKNCTSFCQSHSIPQFILKRISLDGKNYTFYKLLSEDDSFYFFDLEDGNKSAGNFYFICNKCDNEYFKDYESEEKLLSEFNNKMMAEIALKNYIKSISKFSVEIELYRHILDINGFNPILSNYIKYKEIDIKEYVTYSKHCISIIDKNLKSGFKMIYYKKIDYICPIAYQDCISLYTDLNCRVINDKYNYDSINSMKYIHICIFPLTDKTIISIFRHISDTCYKSFEKQLNKLSDSEILKLISFLIINYSEDFYISKKVNDDILSNELIVNVARVIPEIKATSRKEFDKLLLDKKNEISNYKSFINILSDEYKIE